MNQRPSSFKQIFHRLKFNNQGIMLAEALLSLSVAAIAAGILLVAGDTYYSFQKFSEKRAALGQFDSHLTQILSGLSTCSKSLTGDGPIEIDGLTKRSTSNISIKRATYYYDGGTAETPFIVQPGLRISNRTSTYEIQESYIYAPNIPPTGSVEFENANKEKIQVSYESASDTFTITSPSGTEQIKPGGSAAPMSEGSKTRIVISVF